MKIQHGSKEQLQELLLQRFAPVLSGEQSLFFITF